VRVLSAPIGSHRALTRWLCILDPLLLNPRPSSKPIIPC